MSAADFRRVVPLTVAAALFMENMDSSIIATSLPAIAADLGEDPVGLKLAFTSYLISLAIFIPLSGWVADRFGAHRVFQAAIIVFTLASLGCAAAQSLEALVAARSLQGVGGAMMMPVGRAIMLRSVPKARIVDAMVYVTMPALVGPLIGPLLGGFLTVTFDWRWIFWINVPFGVLAITLARLYMPDIGEITRTPFDLAGFLLSGLGLSALVAGLSLAAGSGGLAWLAFGLVVGGSLLCALYVRHARRVSAPILRINLLEIVTLRSSLLGGIFFRAGAGALAFLMPLYLQLGFGFDALESGLVTVAGALGAIMLKLAARPLLRRFGFRRILVWNAIICAAFFAGYAGFLLWSAPVLMFAILLAGGFFRSLQFTSLGALAYADVSPEDMSQASTLFGTVQQIAVAGGVALAALVLEVLRGLRQSSVLLPDDFAIAFGAFALLTLVSALAHRRLPVSAGAAVSGRAVDEV